MFYKIIDSIIDRVRWGYLLAFIILLTSYILTFYSSQQVLNQQQSVMHTTDVIHTLDNLLTTAIEGESSFRGYVVSENEIFLKDYNAIPKQKDSIIGALEDLINESGVQRRNLDSLIDIINVKFAFMSSQIMLFNTSGYVITDAFKEKSEVGKQLMDSVRNQVMKMQQQEKKLVLIMSDKLASFSNLIKIINILSIITAILLFFYSLISFNKEIRAKKLADKQAVEFRSQLENKVNELDNLNTELIELRSIEKFAVTGRLSRTIAHEVRNPLTNINLATEHLRSEIPADEETELLFGMISRNSNRINDLISDLLNSTKASHLNFQKTSVNDLLDSSLAFAQDRVELKKIKVIKHYATDLAPIMADVEKINIAFLNIIVNAVEAMTENAGILTLKTEDKNNRCTVIISDNGKGMDEEAIQRLFEPYFTTKEKGNGLGLTNTQNIIIGHQASIAAQSEVGVGTSFVITFNYS